MEYWQTKFQTFFQNDLTFSKKVLTFVKKNKMKQYFTTSNLIIALVLIIYFSFIISTCINNNKIKSISSEVTFKYDSLAHSMMLPCEHCETVNVILVNGKVSQIVIRADKYEYMIYKDSINIKYK